jgi:hypothetical protein
VVVLKWSKVSLTRKRGIRTCRSLKRCPSNTRIAQQRQFFLNKPSQQTIVKVRRGLSHRQKAWSKKRESRESRASAGIRRPALYAFLLHLACSPRTKGGPSSRPPRAQSGFCTLTQSMRTNRLARSTPSCSLICATQRGRRARREREFAARILGCADCEAAREAQVH